MLSLNVWSPEEIILVRCIEKSGTHYSVSRCRFADKTNVTEYYPVEK
jgi:hypothetical protein